MNDVEEIFSKRGMGLVFLIALTVLSGCGSYEFRSAVAMDEELFRVDVQRAAASAVVFVYVGADAKLCHTVGPLVDGLAETPFGDLKFYHWNAKRFPNIRSVMGFRGWPMAILLEKGNAVDYILSYADSDAVNRALFFRLLKHRIMPDHVFRGHGSAHELLSVDFEKTARSAKRPMVLIFKNDGG